jgi:cbb3-type cytochrome oxidase maturation protein
MNILIMTIPVSITLAILFLLFFLSAVGDDQFENLDTSAQLPLSDEDSGLDEEDTLDEHIEEKMADNNTDQKTKSKDNQNIKKELVKQESKT